MWGISSSQGVFHYVRVAYPNYLGTSYFSFHTCAINTSELGGSMKNLPWESDNYIAGQKRLLLWYSKYHYHAHKNLSSHYVLSQLNPVSKFRSYFLKSILILSYYLRPLLTKCIFHFLHACYTFPT